MLHYKYEQGNSAREEILVCAPAALERPEGVAQQDYAAMEEFQQRTNAVSLEKVKAYYRRLRYAEPGAAPRPPSPAVSEACLLER